MTKAEYEAESKAMGNTTALTNATRLQLRQCLATEALKVATDRLAGTIADVAQADRRIVEETCAAALLLATPAASQTPTSFLGKLMALLSPTPAAPPAA